MSKSSDTPLVSVVVVTWNRKNYLKICIESTKASDYKNIEIIVVDNDSDDGTKEMLKSEFPEVSYIKTDKNIGCGPARNIGFSKAKGKYIVQLDDDATIERRAIGRIVDVFESRSNVGAIAAKIINLDTGENATEDISKCVKNFRGAGAALRTSLLEKTGFYPTEMFFTAEELDLCMRIVDIDYIVEYCPEVVVYHLRAGSEERGRISALRLSNSVCSWLWLFARHFSWPLMGLFCSRVLIKHFFLALRHRRLPSFIRGTAIAFWRLPYILKKRKPLKASTTRYYYNPTILPDRYNIPIHRKAFERLYAIGKAKKPTMAVETG